MSSFGPKQINPTLKSIRKVAGWLWNRGWAEWGAGNISVNITSLFSETNFLQNTERQHHTLPNLSLSLPIAIGSLHPNLHLITSLSGSRMREIMKKPEKGLCIVNFSEKSEPSVIPLSKHERPPSPTSEFASHVLIHQTLMKHRPEYKAVLHTHPAEIIALSQIEGLRSQEAINKQLSEILPELSIYLPEGIAYIPYHVSGSMELAKASAVVMKDFRVAIWEKHGIIATGPTLEEAFDAIDLVAKAARIWFLIKSGGAGNSGVN